MVDQAARNGHALLLAPRKLRGHGLGTVLHIQRGEQFQRARARLGVGHARQHGQQRDVVGHVQKRDQVRCLEDKADAVAPQGPQVVHLPALVVDDLLAQRHAPGGGVDHGAQAFEQCALARARRADEAHHFARSDLHVYALERIHRRVPAAVALAQAFDADAVAVHVIPQWPRPGPRARPCGWRSRWRARKSPARWPARPANPAAPATRIWETVAQQRWP